MNLCKRSEALPSDRIDVTPRRIAALLNNRAERDRSGLYYTEGMRFVHRALEFRSPRIAAVVAAPELLIHPFAQQLRETAKERGVPILTVSAKTFHSFSRVEEPQGIGAVVRQGWEPLYRANPEAGLCWMVLDEVRSAGNLGTILRAMDAVGAAGLILLGNSIDPYAPDVIRATMGSHFALRYVRTDAAAFHRWRRKHGVQLVGTSPHATTDYCALRYPERLALWLGTERTGLDPAQMDSCDAMVRIPMAGAADSLNIAMAGGVMLYEVYNQRVAHRPPFPSIGESPPFY